MYPWAYTSVWFISSILVPSWVLKLSPQCVLVYIWSPLGVYQVHTHTTHIHFRLHAFFCPQNWKSRHVSHSRCECIHHCHYPAKAPLSWRQINRPLHCPPSDCTIRTHVLFIPQIKAQLCKWVSSTWDTSVWCWSDDNIPKCIPPPLPFRACSFDTKFSQANWRPREWRGASLRLWSVITSYGKMSLLINQTLFAKGYISSRTPGVHFCPSERIKK